MMILPSCSAAFLSRRRHARGFTLIELIVVVIILGVLAAVALPRFINLQRDARIAKLQAARGAVMAAQSLVHAAAYARNGTADTAACPADGVIATNLTVGSGTVCTENGVVQVFNAYPAVTASDGGGILSAAGLTGVFKPNAEQLKAEGYTYSTTGNQATFGVVGSSDASRCFFTYTQPDKPGVSAAVSGLTTEGC